jgi:hypothetical protein
MRTHAAARDFTMPDSSSRRAYTVLFGAFDRHNFGDLLFPHVVARMLAPRDMLHAGLAARDLRPWGGHAVRAFGDLAPYSREREREYDCEAALNVIHAGGELLTCDAWEASVMLAPTGHVQAAIAEEEAWRHNPLGWAKTHLDTASRAPYVISTTSFPHVHLNTVAFHAVGGADLDRRDPAFRSEVFDKIRSANHISVRDTQTQAHLRAEGIEAALVPDPVVMVAELFGEQIRKQAACDAVKSVLDAFPQGYVALQFDATFGDDSTLDGLAREIKHVIKAEGLGIAMFRAGAAPWHDDLDVYRRLAARLAGLPVRVFTSLHLWDICALVAHSRVFCGSSLHGRVVAMAFARPRINIVHADTLRQTSKQAAFAATWEAPGMPATTNVNGVANAIGAALRTDTALMQHTASDLARRYRASFNASDN